MVTQPRSAAGRFTAARAEVPKRSVADRHAEAKAELKRLEAERDSIMAQRKGFLVSDDRRAARQCGHALRELELALQEARDLDDYLLPEVRRERQQQTQKTMPTDLPSVLKALSDLEPRLVQLASIPWQALDAGKQAELDALRQRQYYLTGLAGRMRPEETKAS